MFFSDSTSLKFDDITASFVFFGGGQGGLDTVGFPVKIDSTLRVIRWRELTSLEIAGGFYGKIERWPCLRDANVEVGLRNGTFVRETVDCLFWVEVILPPDASGKIEKRTVRFFTADGALNICKITME